MSAFKPTHRLSSGALVELEHIFASRKTGRLFGLFLHEYDGCSIGYMDDATKLPKVLQVAEHQEPEPLRVAPKVGSTYWFLDYLTLEGVRCLAWADDNLDHRILLAGEARATKEDALATLAARQKARGFA